MSETLTIFGIDYPDTEGFKVKDDLGIVHTYGEGGGSSLGTKSIVSNGTYNASSDGYDGYSQVTVNVPSGSPTLQTKTKSYTPTETQQTEAVSADSGYDGLDTVNVTVGAISSTYVGTGIARRSSSDVDNGFVGGEYTISVPSGYYESTVTKYPGELSVPTPTANKGTVSNHSVNVTPSVTTSYAIYRGGTKTGTAVSVSASELVSGSETKTANGTYDVTNLASLVVAIPFSTITVSSSNPTGGSNGDVWIKTS